MDLLTTLNELPTQLQHLNAMAAAFVPDPAGSHSLTAGSGATTVAAEDDLIGWASQKALDVQNLIRVLAGVVASAVMLWALFMARMAMAKLLMLGATCALGLWFVFNITDAQARIDNEINGAPAPSVVVEHLTSPHTA